MGVSSHEQRFSDALYSQHGEIERSSKRYMREMVPCNRPLSILDVGCGTGLNASVLREMGHTVVGVDLSPVAIEKFTALGFEGHVCDIVEGLPFDDDRFDLVYASEVIEHVNDTASFLAELTRVLSPGGRLVLSTPNSAFWPFRLVGLLGWTVSEIQHPGHVRFFSKRSLTRAMTEAGLVNVRVSARHMYVLLPDGLARPLGPVFQRIGFEREYRLKTGSHLWHLNRLARNASPFWADTFIVMARKAENGGTAAPTPSIREE